MGKGYLQVQLYVGDFTLHGQQMAVQIIKDGEIIHIAETDEGGATEIIGLEAPSLTSGAPAAGTQPFAAYDVIVPEASGYKKVSVYGVQIFDGITSVLDINMEPLSEVGPQEINIHVPRERGASNDMADNNLEAVPTSWAEMPKNEAPCATIVTIDIMASEIFRKYMTKPLPDNFDITTFLLALMLIKNK